MRFKIPPHDIGKCRNEVNMREGNINICNLQLKCIATNSKYEYKLPFSLEMILDFAKSFDKTCPCRHI